LRLQLNVAGAKVRLRFLFLDVLKQDERNYKDPSIG
jgi:hypothetical protein